LKTKLTIGKDRDKSMRKDLRRLRISERSLNKKLMKRRSKSNLKINLTMANEIDTTKVAEEVVDNRSQTLHMSRKALRITTISNMRKVLRKEVADAKGIPSSKLHQLRMHNISLREERHLPNRLDKLYK
jgi:hypothetical protein